MKRITSINRARSYSENRRQDCPATRKEVHNRSRSGRMGITWNPILHRFWLPCVNRTIDALWLLLEPLSKPQFRSRACSPAQLGSIAHRLGGNTDLGGSGLPLELGNPYWQLRQANPPQRPSRCLKSVSCNSTFLNFHYPGAGFNRNRPARCYVELQNERTTIPSVSESWLVRLRETLPVSPIVPLALGRTVVHNGYC